MPSTDKLRALALRAGVHARPVLIAAAYLLPVALIVSAVTFWGRGIIDSEAMEFVLNYLQKRPFFAQIFDPQINDWGAYQAREFSYVFDLIDARVFATLLDHGVLLFVPLSGVVGLVAVSGVYFYGARKIFAINRAMTCMLLSLFLSCIVVQASTPILYRSSKIILSVALLGFLFYTFSLLKIDKRPVTVLKGGLLFFIGLIMALCDRQGFYYLISTTIALGLLWLMRPSSNTITKGASLLVVFVNCASIGSVIFYDRLFAPWLIHALNGYWPHFFYQNLPWSNVFDPTLPTKAWQLFQQQVSFFFGNVPFVVLATIVAIVIFGIIWKRRSVINRNNLTGIAISLVSIAAIIVLLAVMIARHPAVYTIRDHSFWYYTLSVHVVILFGISAWIGLASSGNAPRSNWLIYGLIGILIGCNALGYARQRNVMIHSTGWFEEQYIHSRALVAQFTTAPPEREKLQHPSDLFLDDQVHFLENVERAYLYLTETSQTDPTREP